MSTSSERGRRCAAFTLLLVASAAAGRAAPPQSDGAQKHTADDTVEFGPKELERIRRLSPPGPLPADPTNRVADDARAARLGQWLFFDARLSSTGEVSCATCHDPALSFADGKPLAETLGRATRHTPTVLNAAYQRWFFWDGRADSLWSQALGPIENPVEMGFDRTALTHLFASDEGLRVAYERVFGPLPDVSALPAHARPAPGSEPDETSAAWAALAQPQRDAIDRVFANAGKALAAYERRLVRLDAPFDHFVRELGREPAPTRPALSVPAQRGLALFVGRGKCTLCHNGPLLSDLEFHNTSAPPLDGGALRDPGRYAGARLVKESRFNASGPYSDERDGAKAGLVRRLRRTSESWGEFKTPSLRNVSEHPPYMHQGQFADLAAVIRFYSTLEGAAGRSHHQEQVLVPLNLTEQEASDLEAFLASLTGAPLDPDLKKRPASPALPD